MKVYTYSEARKLSPLDVPGVKLKVSTGDLVAAVRGIGR